MFRLYQYYITKCQFFQHMFIKLCTLQDVIYNTRKVFYRDSASFVALKSMLRKEKFNVKTLSFYIFTGVFHRFFLL